MAKTQIKVIKQSKTGRNIEFIDQSGRTMKRGELADRIEQGEFPDYHVRRVNGLRTPAANPDGKKGNNLG